MMTDNKQEFPKKAEKRANSNNNAEMVALVTPAEQRNKDLASPPPHLLAVKLKAVNLDVTCFSSEPALHSSSHES